MIKAASFASAGAVIGCATALVLPTISPVAGLINGFSFGLIMSKTGESFSQFNREDSSVHDKMLYLAVVTISMISTAVLSFLSCLALNHPISFAACLIFPWQMGIFCSLSLLPYVVAKKGAELIHATYLRLTT